MFDRDLTCSSGTPWQYNNPRSGQWTDLPKRISVKLEKHRTNSTGCKPCVIELNDIEYKMDFGEMKAIDTRNFHRWLDIKRCGEDDAAPIDPPAPIPAYEPEPVPEPVPEPPVDEYRPPTPPPVAAPPPPVARAPPAQAPLEEFVPVPRYREPEASHDMNVADLDGEPAPCRLHVARVSLNCAAIMLLLKEGNVIHDIVDVDLMKGEHRTPAFRALNPLMQVPVLEDEDGTVVWESNAILRYICNTFSLEDHFYPTSSGARARLEMALDWRQTTLYPHIAKVAYPGLGFSDKFHLVEEGLAEVKKDLDLLTNFWLRDRMFICGSRPSIADLAIGMPLLMLEASIELPPRLGSYVERLSQEFESWDHVTASFYAYLDSLQ